VRLIRKKTKYRIRTNQIKIKPTSKTVGRKMKKNKFLTKKKTLKIINKIRKMIQNRVKI
jgi:hypothetical protein